MKTPNVPLRRNLAIFTGVLSLLAATASQVTADGAHHGTTCFASVPTAKLGKSSFGLTALPDSGTTMNSYCPLIRTNTANTTGLDDLEMFVTKSQSSDGVNFPVNGLGCTALSLTVNGNFEDAVTVSTTMYGYQKLNFAGNLSVSVSKGTYLIMCGMNKGDIIHSIWSDEP
jgi:hypothetical protein